LQWIRVATDKYSTGASGSSGKQTSKSGFELLDSPGIIPSDMIDQSDALLLAACKSVGVGAYDNQVRICGGLMLESLDTCYAHITLL